MFGDFKEPPLDSLADTNPIQPLRRKKLPAWRRAVGWLSLFGTLGFMGATAFLLLTSGGDPQPALLDTPPTQSDAPTLAPTVTVAATIAQRGQAAPTVAAAVPTVAPDVLAALLDAPLEALAVGGDTLQIARDVYNPFTLIPDRPRNEVIQYQIQRGDSIFSIAERFGLKPETIAWSNDRSIIQVLRPGRELNILPVDGVYHTVVGSRPLGQILASYNIDDPYMIIDSEYNPDLFGVSPDDTLPSGTRIVIPGGEAEQIAWTPPVERESGGGSGNAGGDFITFAPGQPGSCGRQPNPGGGAAWARPIGAYSWVRGFTTWHTGVDLAANEGTPVFAANGGRVIFAGWNVWGYGNTIVLAHGPFTTLYGHLSTINVRCGETVVPGQPIGGVGSTGNSSGPHLHFEIRFLDQPQNPTATIAF